MTQQIQSSLQQLGLDQSLGAMFGQHGAPAPPAEPEYVAALAEPPRHVPFSYKLATFDLSVYELFILVIGLHRARSRSGSSRRWSSRPP